MMHCKSLVLLFAAAVLVSSCKKKDPPLPETPVNPAAPHRLVVDFRATANETTLVPGTITYTNASEDTFSVTKFTYYISNIVFRKADGTAFAEPESYHLIRHIDGKTSFTLSGMPDGEYTTVEFLIGVDSLRNVTGAQTGALDPANDMFWDWNTGYIFYKLEGVYRNASNTQPKEFAMHIGGFSGEENCIQKCSFTLPNAIVAKGDGVSGLHYRVSVDEIFRTPTSLGFDDYFAAVVNGPKIFRTVSANYRDMFTVEKVEN
jgi:hypothetical protein